MRVVALEEHFTVPALAGRIDRAAVSRRGFRPRRADPGGPANEYSGQLRYPLLR